MHNKNYIAAEAGVERCSDPSVLKNTQWQSADAINKWLPFLPACATQWLASRSSLGIVKNDSQGVTRAAMHAADTVSQIDAIIAARPFHRPVPCRENDRLPLIRAHHFGLRLRARLLFDQNKLAAFPIASLLP